MSVHVPVPLYSLLNFELCPGDALGAAGCLRRSVTHTTARPCLTSFAMGPSGVPVSEHGLRPAEDQSVGGAARTAGARAADATVAAATSTATSSDIAARVGISALATYGANTEAATVATFATGTASGRRHDATF